MAVHPSPRWLVGLCGNFQLTEREKGEQPIGTQQLGRVNTKPFFWGEGNPLISAVDARSFLRRNGHGLRPPSVAARARGLRERLFSLRCEKAEPADCTKKVNKGIVKKESPMTVVLHTINLNNEKLSWGKTSYPNSQGIHRALAGENLHQKNCRTSWLQPGGHFKGNQTKFQ